MRAILVILLLASFTYSQEVVASLQLDRKEPQPLWFEYVRADDGLATLSYMTKSSSRYIGIFKYDANFKRTWRKQFLQNTIRNEVVHFSVLGERIYIFVGLKKPGTKGKQLLLFIYDLEGNAIIEQQKIAETNSKRGLREVFTFKKSTDRNALICLQSYAEKDADSLRFTYLFFEKGEDQYASRDFTLPYQKKQLKVQQLEFSKTGALYILGKRKIIADGLDRARFSLFTLKTELEETPLYFFENVITDLIFKLSPSEEVFLGGFFSRKRKDQVYGLVYARLDSATHEMSLHSFLPFSETFLNRYLSDRQLARGKELTDYYLDDIILRSDGGMLFLAEQFYINYTNTFDPNGFSNTQTVYNYLDVAAFSVSQDGELEWSAVIDKFQSAQNKLQLGYFSAIGPSGIYFFFKEYYKGNGTNVFYVRSDFEGGLTKPKGFLEEFRSRDVFYRSACEQITNSQAVIAYQKRGVFSLVKLQL